MSPLLLGVLRRLSHEDFVSGEVIARHLGCSRATVNNAIREAISGGVPVHAVHGRGYRLSRPLSWLDPERLVPAFSARGLALHCFDELESTNDHLLRWAQGGAPHRAVISAEWQSQGRGRRGRTWHAGLGGGLAFSLLWRSARPTAELAGLSLAVGAALVAVLRGMGLARAMVKWPNDVQVDGAKLAGVLIELSGDMLGPSAAVIGVGVNVLGSEALARQLGQPVADLRQHLGDIDRNALFLALAAGLDEALARFESGGFSAFREEWQACHAYHERDVLIHPGQGSPIPGRVRGVDEQGALLLETEAGLLRFHSGEVSVRPVGP
jgi:BirA family transcriptional regulator, biotin operon repressor / biotin---[acetyl-CoA-carboxylase] ligase